MAQTFPFILTNLPYADNALEPYIDEKTVNVHHNRHLKTYIDNLNTLIVAYPELQNMTVEQLLLNPNQIPAYIRQDVLNNAGGVYNHNLYFEIIGPPNNSVNTSYFPTLIKKHFGSMNRFQTLFINAATKVFGSGYAWLVLTKDNQLAIIITQNQDTPLLLGVTPLFLIDVWEHAYYLKYLNMRKEYAKNFFQVLNWDVIEQRYENANK